MPEKITKKIEQTTKAVKAFQILWREVKKALYSIIIVIALGVYIKENPDVLMKQASKVFIHNEVVNETKNAHTLEYDTLKLEIKDIKEQLKKSKNIKNSVINIKKDVNLLSERDAAQEKHLKYIDGGLSNVVNFAKREADKKRNNQCNYEWRETNDGKEFIVVYGDAYEVDMIYPLEQEDNCQGFYEDILNKTKIRVR